MLLRTLAGILLALTVSAAALVHAQQSRAFRPITVAKKRALLIGNQRYPASPLGNPVRDAKKLAAALRELGFDEVTALEDLTLEEMEQAVLDFRARLAGGDLGVFYYAGHGMQVNRENFLLPVDYRRTSASAVKYDALSASKVRDLLEDSGARLRVMILDACRNNPFKPGRSALDGLAPMAAGAEGTLIAFATGDDNIATDSGLYVEHLVPQLARPGLELRQIFQRTKEAVYVASNRAQNPTIYEDVVGRYYLNGPPAPGDAGGAATAAAQTWAALQGTTVEAALEAFIRDFRDQAGAGAYVALAEARLAELRGREPVPLVVNGVEMEFVAIPAGEFMMGCSPGDDDCAADEKPRHRVRIRKGFEMGKYEVTQAQWEAVMGSNPSYFKGADRPVERVSWEDVQAYIEKVNARARDGYRYRLPTEAEWEYAARAGTTGARYGDLDEIAWFGDNSGRARLDAQRLWDQNMGGYGKKLQENGNSTHPVGAKAPNGLGLHDMLGNVWEWCEDWYDADYYDASAEESPQGPGSGELKVLRGGSWDYFAWYVRASDRYWVWPSFRLNVFGFRLVRER